MDEVRDMHTFIDINSLLLSWESHHWDTFAIYSLLQGWGSVPLMALTAFATLEDPTGTGLIKQLLARFWYSVAWVTI